MMRGRSTTTLLLLPILGLAACTCQGAPAPVLGSVAPTQARTDVFTTLAIRGDHFQAQVQVDFDSPGDSRVNAAFNLWLVAGDIRVPLAEVSLVSDTELSAQYLNLAAEPGVYDLELLDPRGHRALLQKAFTVTASNCARAPDGTACDDGNACTTGETCKGGKCRNPTSVVRCTSTSDCLGVSSCQRSTGLCHEVLKRDGTACSDGNACTLSASCLPGACVRAGLVSCAPPPECRLAGTCDPASQACQYPPAQDGATCTAAGSCVAGQACLAGGCACVNTAPLACFTVTPTSGDTTISFTFDGSCSSDLEDPTSALTVEFDLDGSGTWVRADAGGRTAKVLGAAGIRSTLARVTDTGGLTAYAERRVAIAKAADEVLVTTLVDENDPGATPGNPGGTWFSLREAVAYVNGLPAGTPAKTISFSPAASGNLLLGSPLDPLTAPGATIVGRPDILLDFQRANKACLTLDAAGQTLLGLRLTGCDATAILLSPRSTGSLVAECTLAGPGSGTNSIGIQVQSASVVGPGNDASGYGTGVRFPSLGGTLDGNRLHGNGTGAMLTGVATAGAQVQRNVFYANSGDGLQVTQSPGLTRAWFNVFDGNGRNGLSAALGAPLEVRNDLFTGNGALAVSATSANFAVPESIDHNGFSGNGGGNLAPGLALTASVLADPRYVDRAGGDFRLLPGSPAIDAGVDLGLDVNGPASGAFNGAAPDLGGTETSY